MKVESAEDLENLAQRLDATITEYKRGQDILVDAREKMLIPILIQSSSISLVKLFGFLSTIVALSCHKEGRRFAKEHG